MSSEDRSSSSAGGLNGISDKLTAGWNEQLQEVSGTLSSILDQGLTTASDAVRSSTAAASSEANKAAAQAKDLYSLVELKFKEGEAVAFGYLKEGVNVALANKELTIAGAVGLAAVGVPSTRRFLLRQTIGRFRSEEAMFKSAELHSASLAEKVASQAQEVTKLQERLGLAQAEYTRGLSKLKATASELQSLSSRIGSTRRSAAGLVDDLRALPSKQALALRAEVAQKAATSEAQRKVVNKMVLGLAKQGI